ncbi:aminoglycoside phosphotransferase family protein [Streptomyces sp. 35G-GA-8]|uniref:aminoglycoside phosphotransferase family protein n=1 Tax=Streptomyces sp. 35G-GA-8 TaxID=2939434 RepID=UPI00201EA0E8|nr:aminoglycoside phosphotransferase family protein [Streptomyces sp. 35G-GA-8]MCL7380261.1 aminoglycoside phosphotransferase family protein [Streptomyces sp. 35G-GA-8]
MGRFTHAPRIDDVIDIPAELVETQSKILGETGRAFIAALPGRAADFLERWELRRTGPSMYGMCALVLPVERADGTPAVLKLQHLDEESAGEPVALRVWGGDGAVRLLGYDDETGTLLLERLDTRDLNGVDSREAVRVIAELLARLTAVPAPAGMRGLGEVAARMLDDVPVLSRSLPEEAERRLLRDCAAAVREVVDEPGDRLLHWDLHYENVLASHPADAREPWLAIDPKPLAGDPGFDLMPALDNRFDAAETVWRFDLMTEVLGLDRERARAWTLGRVLQNSLWDIADGERALNPEQVSIARSLLAR